MALCLSLVLYMRSSSPEINQNCKNYFFRLVRQFFKITVSDLRTLNLPNSSEEKIQLAEIPLSNFINVAPGGKLFSRTATMKIKPPGPGIAGSMVRRLNPGRRVLSARARWPYPSTKVKLASNLSRMWSA